MFPDLGSLSKYWPSSYSYMVDISLYMFGQQLPTFACPYNAGSPGTCYLIAMQHGLHITWSELISYRGLAFFIGLLTFVLFFIIFNKSWCGFMCPLGTLQDWITQVRKLTLTKFHAMTN